MGTSHDGLTGTRIALPLLKNKTKKKKNQNKQQKNTTKSIKLEIIYIYIICFQALDNTQPKTVVISIAFAYCYVPFSNCAPLPEVQA